MANNLSNLSNISDILDISDIMDARCIRLELAAYSKVGAITELAQCLESAGKIDDATLCVNEILDRENISSTGIGHGIAIPHRLIAGVKTLSIALGRKGKGIPFDSVDGKPAHLIFLIIGPQGQNIQYLRILGKLSGYLNDRTFFESLMTIKSEREAIELVKEREL